jgi:hypothetical protein
MFKHSTYTSLSSNRPGEPSRAPASAYRSRVAYSFACDLGRISLASLLAGTYTETCETVQAFGSMCAYGVLSKAETGNGMP